MSLKEVFNLYREMCSGEKQFSEVEQQINRYAQKFQQDRRFGVKRTKIRQLYNLLNKAFRQAEEGKMSLGHALLLASLKAQYLLRNEREFREEVKGFLNYLLTLVDRNEIDAGFLSEFWDSLIAVISVYAKEG